MKYSNNNSVDAQEADYLYVGPSQIPNSGNGLYTAIDIFRDETISIFKGEMLTNTQAKKREQAGKDHYFINLPDGRIMDSMNVKCFAKFANDAKGNTKTKHTNNTIITINEDGEVCIEALKNIKAHEELFCSYGKRYWKKHGQL